MSDLLRAALARMLEQARLPSHQYGYPQPDQMLATPAGKALAALVAAVADSHRPTDTGCMDRPMHSALDALCEAVKP